MHNILILGANGRIAHFVKQDLLAKTDFKLTYFLRNSSRLSIKNSKRENIVEGDAAKVDDLEPAMDGIDIVYANLAGDNIVQQAEAIVKAMQNQNVKRIYWVSSLGIYDEVPGAFGEWNNKTLDGYLQPYAKAASIIEKSDLESTIIRPAWLTDQDEVSYEITHKNEPFKGTEVSRKTVGTVISQLIQEPTKDINDSIGINKPNTDGDKPAWY